MRIVPQNEEELEALADLEDEPGVLFWGRPAANLSLDMVVAPNMADDVKQYLADSNMDYTVLNVNVQVRHYIICELLNNTLTNNACTLFMNRERHVCEVVSTLSTFLNPSSTDFVTFFLKYMWGALQTFL